MCFSAEVSFTASAVLIASGSYILKNCSSKSLLLIASIPILFGLQQLFEGILWLNLDRRLDEPFLFKSSANAYLMFAFLIWPVWIPLAFMVAEKNQRIKKIMLFALGCGTLLSLANLYYGLKQQVSIDIINHSLQYLAEVPSQMYIYPLIILLPCFLSTVKSVKSFAFLVTLGYLVAYYFYSHTFVSVWCFFSAIVSLAIYQVVREDNKENAKSSLSS